jgi:hypothetical protein
LSREAIGHRTLSELFTAGSSVGAMVPLIFGTLVLLWGTFVITFPQIVAGWIRAAERAGLTWSPLARWGSAWMRLLGAVLAVVGLVTAVTGLRSLLG